MYVLFDKLLVLLGQNWFTARKLYKDPVFLVLITNNGCLHPTKTKVYTRMQTYKWIICVYIYILYTNIHYTNTVHPITCVYIYYTGVLYVIICIYIQLNIHILIMFMLQTDRQTDRQIDRYCACTTFDLRLLTRVWISCADLPLSTLDLECSSGGVLWLSKKRGSTMINWAHGGYDGLVLDISWYLGTSMGYTMLYPQMPILIGKVNAEHWWTMGFEAPTTFRQTHVFNAPNSPTRMESAGRVGDLHRLKLEDRLKLA